MQVIPLVCRRHPSVHFIVAGDGPKRAAMEATVQAHGLQQRVEMVGEVAHSNVRDVLTRGHIFLNCSRTESFCIAILEVRHVHVHSQLLIL